MRHAFAAILSLPAVVGGCSSSAPPGMQADLTTTPPDFAVTARSYTVEVIAPCGQSGFQTQIAVAPGSSTVGLVSFSNTPRKGTCTLPMRPPMDVPEYDLCFGESTGGAQFVVTQLSSEHYLGFTGVALAYSPTGEAHVAYTGNAAGVMQAERRCGATNLLLKSGKGGGFGAPRTIATSSQSGGLVPDQMANCIQDVCNSGDATGFWPAIAFSPGGVPSLAWRDIHFGVNADDFESSDVEYAAGPGFSALTVDVARGGGSYTRLAFNKTGQPVVAHYNGERERTTNGIWVNQNTGAAWVATRVTGARAGEMLGFAIGPTGLYALAYHDPDNPRLVYMESMDGVTWSAPTDVDTDGITGQFPSLAFDGAGEPAIAYYRCRDYHPMDRSCDLEKDGLMLARRTAGQWSVESVSARSGVFDGLYPALAFVGGKAVVAFQLRSFDPGSGNNSFQLDVARED